MSNGNGGDRFANFFLGLGLGVGIGILIAPKSGEETRDMLMAKADEGKEYLKKQTAGLRDSATDIAEDLKARGEELKTRGEELINRGKEVLNRQKYALDDAIEAGKQAYRDKVEEPTSSSETV